MNATLALRDLRRRKGLSQQQLANNSGLSRLTVVHLEGGKSEGQPSTLAAIASALAEPTEVVWAALQESRRRAAAEGAGESVAGGAAHAPSRTDGGAA